MKPLDDKDAALLLFKENIQRRDKGGSPDWEELRREWNQKCPIDDWKYSEKNKFRMAFKDIEKKVYPEILYIDINEL